MKDFKKYYIVNTRPDQVYKALTTETTLLLWTGEHVEISAVEGGEFALWGGAITGKFISLEPYTKLVQEWFFGEQPEKSIVTMKFHESGKSKTSLEIRHKNIPDEAYEDIVTGWDDVYMHNLIDFFEEEEQ